MRTKDIPIAIWAPPYNSLANYIAKEKRSGYNADGSRGNESCAQNLMGIVLGSNAVGDTFESRISTAKLISSDVTFFSPGELELGELDGNLEHAFMIDIAEEFERAFAELEADRMAKVLSNPLMLQMMFWNAMDAVAKGYRDSRTELSALDGESRDLLEKFRRAMRDYHESLSESEQDQYCQLLVSCFEAFYCLEDIREHCTTHLFLSRNPIISNYAMTAECELSAANVLGVLAASGIQIGLPHIGEQDHEVLDKVREKFRSPLQKYLGSLCELAEQARDGIKNGDYRNVEQFANQHIEFKLRPALNALDDAIRNSRIAKFKNLVNVVSESGADLVSSAVTGDLLAAGKSALEVVFKSIPGMIPDHTRESVHPMAAYIYSVQGKL